MPPDTTTNPIAKSPKRSPIYQPGHIELPLTRGLVAIVDLNTGPAVLRCTWFAEKGGYAVACCGGARIKLHRVLLGLAAGDGIHADHIDGDPLNNRMSNLRACTPRQNMSNQGGHRGSTSHFRGVSWDNRDRKWRVVLSWRRDGKKINKYLGYFADEEDAARAWDRAAVESGLYDPAFLRLNFPDEHHRGSASAAAAASGE
jgi:hypothetical protein